MFHVEPNTNPGQINCPLCGASPLSEKLSTEDFFLTHEPFTIMECAVCHLAGTYPQPIKQNIGRYYQSTHYISHTDEETDIMSRIYRIIRGITLRKKFNTIAKYHRQGSLLDIGCGTGHLLHHFAQRGWQVTGIEPGEEPRNFAVQRFGLDVRDEAALAAIPTGSFDVVSMWHVLEHVHDVKERMQEVFRILREDGLAVIALPNPASADAVYYGKYWAAWDVPRHLHHFRREALGFLASQTGFTVIDTLPMRYDAFYVAMLSERYKNGKNRYLPALFRGLLSNLSARMNKGEFSSLVYLLRKDPASATKPL